MAHANARLGPAGRRRLVHLICECGWPERRAAESLGVSRATAHRWKRRWLDASAEARQSGRWARDRSSRPHRSPRRTPAQIEQRVLAARERTGWGPRLIAGQTGVAHSTVHAILRRHGRSRPPRAPHERFVRYEWPCPGDLLHMDVKKLGRFTEPGHAVTGDRTKRSRRVGWEYVHSIVDDCSRLAYSEIHDDEKAATVTAFTRRALDWFLAHGIVCERLMTDNAFAYIHNRSLRELLDRRAIRHLRTRPYTPRTNGKVERYQQTLEFPRFRGHLIAGPSGPAGRISVHAVDPAISVGVPPRGGPAAQDERPFDPAAGEGARLLAAVAA